MKDNSRIIVTKNENKIICYQIEENNAVRLFITQNLAYSIGDIIIARVQTVKPDLNASFVELDKDTIAFLPHDEINPKCLLNRSFDGRLKQGDEICVMVSKEPVKTKPWTVSMNLNIQGQYSIIHNEDNNVSVSTKLSKPEREEFKQFFSSYLKETNFGMIIRTNASKADKNIVVKEIDNNLLVLNNVCKIMNSRTVYSKIYQAAPSYIDVIRGINSDEYAELVTDDEDIFSILNTYFPENKDSIRLYDNSSLSISALYNLKRAFDDATKEKIQLKSGGYIIIEPTEALTVIDVNSGKAQNKTKISSIHNVNLEAAKEIARQLKLRNISGIIIIDFINYDKKDSEKENELIDELKKLIKSDNIKTSFIDITNLGLVELTRQKKYASIYEMMNS